MKTGSKIIVTILISTILTACGGGGDSSVSPGVDGDIVTTSIGSGGGSLNLSDGSIVTFDSGVLNDGATVKAKSTTTPSLPLPSEVDLASSIVQVEFSSTDVQQSASTGSGIIFEVPTQTSSMTTQDTSISSNAYKFVQVNISSGKHAITAYARYVVNQGKAVFKITADALTAVTKYGQGQTVIQSFIVSAIRCFSGAQLDNLYQVNSPDDFSDLIVPDYSKTPLILVHGYQVGPDHCKEAYKTTWNTFLRYFFNDSELKSKFQVFSFSYNTANSIQSSGDLLAQKITNSFGSSPVIVLAHSMGGLVARSSLVNSGANIQGLITLATPHHGTPLVDIYDQTVYVLSVYASLAIEGPFFLAIPTPGRDDLAWDQFDGWTGLGTAKGNNFLVQLNKNDTYLSRYIPYAGVTSKAPYNIEASATTDKIYITWDSSITADKFNIYYSNTPGVTKNNGLKIEVTGPLHYYIHKDISAGKPYYYMLTTVKNGVEGPESLEVSATTPDISSNIGIRESVAARLLLELGPVYENDTIVPEVSARFQDYSNGVYSDKPFRRQPRSYLNIGHKAIHEDYVYLDQGGNPIFLNKIFPDIKTDLLGFAASVTDTTPPTVPTDLTATAASSNKIDLSWTASTDDVGVSGYNIYRDGVLAGSSATTSYNDTGLNASTQYCYTVSAFDASGNESARSAQACATTKVKVLSWAKTYGGFIGHDYAYAIQQTRDGGYIVAGETSSYGAGDYDLWVLKLDASGNVTWQKTYGGVYFESAYTIQQTTDGGYIVAGGTASFGDSSDDIWVLKLDTSGNVTWQKTYGGASFESAHSIQQTKDGGYIVAGATSSYGAGDNDLWVLKLDAGGNVTWQKTYGGTGWDSAWSIEQTTDGGYVVAGLTNSYGKGNSDLWVLKLDAGGNVTWQKSYGEAGYDRAYTIQQTKDGGYIVAGATSSYGAGYSDLWVLKLDASGNITWQRAFGGSYFDEAYAIQQTTDGGYIVAGYNSYSNGGTSSPDLWVLKLDASGNVTWEKTYGGGASYWDEAWAVRQTADGGYIVAGLTDSYGAGSGDLWVLKLDGNGDIGGTCGLGAATNATVTDTTVTPVDSTATVTDTAAFVAATTVVPKDTTATTATQCSSP